jgi:hypothetical protein
MMTALLRSWDFAVETVGILLGIPKYLDRGLDPEIKRVADSPSARAYYHHPR